MNIYMISHISFKIILLIIYLISANTTQFNKCRTEFQLLWQHDVGPTPFAASPLIADVDNDGWLDVLAAPFSGQVYVVHGRNGRPLTGSHWPHTVPHSSVHASPIQHDVDGDGIFDILICTSQAELLALSANGSPIEGKHYQIPDVYIRRDWYAKVLTADRVDIHSFILDGQPSKNESDLYVHVAAHILATPALADLNMDGTVEELVIPVSYYLEEQQHSLTVNKTGLPELSELDNYLVSALVIFNLTSMTPMQTIHMDLTKVRAEYPAYVLSSPTVVQFDGGQLDIVVGTSAGQLHRLNASGHSHPGFPLPMDSVLGQVAIDDLNNDGQLELVVVDRGGNVECYSPEGDAIWNVQLSDAPTSGVMFADLDDDGRLDVVVGCVDGQVWVLDGDSGQVMPNWPVKVAQSMVTPVTIVHMMHSDLPTVVVLADDRHIHMLTSGGDSCRHVVGVDELSFVSVLSHNLDPTVPGLELLVASQDGSLLCFRQVLTPDQFGATTSVDLQESNAWPSESAINPATFWNGKRGVAINRPVQVDLGVVDYSDSEFIVTFYIYDTAKQRNPYNVSVLLGGRLLVHLPCERAGAHSVRVSGPRLPFTGQLCVRLTNRHAQVFINCMAVRFHKIFLSDLQWLLTVPSIFLAVVLLFLHGFPKTDLLPVTLPSKRR